MPDCTKLPRHLYRSMDQNFSPGSSFVSLQKVFIFFFQSSMGIKLQESNCLLSLPLSETRNFVNICWRSRWQKLFVDHQRSQETNCWNASFPPPLFCLLTAQLASLFLQNHPNWLWERLDVFWPTWCFLQKWPRLKQDRFSGASTEGYPIAFLKLKSRTLMNGCLTSNFARWNFNCMVQLFVCVCVCVCVLFLFFCLFVCCFFFAVFCRQATPHGRCRSLQPLHDIIQQGLCAQEYQYTFTQVSSTLGIWPRQIKWKELIHWTITFTPQSCISIGIFSCLTRLKRVSQSANPLFLRPQTHLGHNHRRRPQSYDGVGDTTYQEEYDRKAQVWQDPAQCGRGWVSRPEPIRSGTASGTRRNNPHPLQVFTLLLCQWMCSTGTSSARLSAARVPPRFLSVQTAQTFSVSPIPRFPFFSDSCFSFKLSPLSVIYGVEVECAIKQTEVDTCWSPWGFPGPTGQSDARKSMFYLPGRLSGCPSRFLSNLSLTSLFCEWERMVQTKNFHWNNQANHIWVSFKTHGGMKAQIFPFYLSGFFSFVCWIGVCWIRFWFIGKVVIVLLLFP